MKNKSILFFFLFFDLVEDNNETLSTLIMNLQPSKDKDFSYEDSKISDFNDKFNELKENLQKPNELKEFEDFDLKCIETSFHQQRTELRRKSSNKKNVDMIQLVSPTSSILDATASDDSSRSAAALPLQRKRANVDADIRPCEPNER